MTTNQDAVMQDALKDVWMQSKNLSDVFFIIVFHWLCLTPGLLLEFFFSFFKIYVSLYLWYTSGPSSPPA